MRVTRLFMYLLKIDTLWSWIAWLILNGDPRRRLFLWQYNLHTHYSHHYVLNVKNCRQWTMWQHGAACSHLTQKYIHYKMNILYLQIGIYIEIQGVDMIHLNSKASNFPVTYSVKAMWNNLCKVLWKGAYPLGAVKNLLNVGIFSNNIPYQKYAPLYTDRRIFGLSVSPTIPKPSRLPGIYRRSWYFHTKKTQIHAGTPLLYGVLEAKLKVIL